MFSSAKEEQYTTTVIGVGADGCAAVRKLIEEQKEETISSRASTGQDNTPGSSFAKGMKFICVNAGQDDNLKQEALCLHTGKEGDHDALKDCLDRIRNEITRYSFPLFIVFNHDGTTDTRLIKHVRSAVSSTAAETPLLMVSAPCDGSDASLRQAWAESRELKKQLGDVIVFPAASPDASSNMLACAVRHFKALVSKPNRTDIPTEHLEIARYSDGLSILCKSDAFTGKGRMAHAAEDVLNAPWLQKLKRFGGGKCKVLFSYSLGSFDYSELQEWAEMGDILHSAFAEPDELVEYREADCLDGDFDESRGDEFRVILFAGGFNPA